MFRKSLLASIALVNLNAVQAHQPSHPQMQHPTQNSSHTISGEPCPPGSEKAWIITEGPHKYMIFKDGRKVNLDNTPDETPSTIQHHGQTQPEQQPQLHHEEPQHHKPTEAEKDLKRHPLPTAEQEKLERELKRLAPRIYLRANPNSPDPTKKEGEWGKALGNKVYFKELGVWVYDPSVNAKTDVVSTGVKDRIKALNADASHKPSPTTAEPTATVEPTTMGPTATAEPTTIAEKSTETTGTNAGAEIKAETTAPSSSSSTTTSKGGWIKTKEGGWTRANPPPDALGTTNRPNLVHIDPTRNNEPQFSLGAPNRAQTNVTGVAIPRPDASANSGD